MIRKWINRLNGGTTVQDADGNIVGSGKTVTDALDMNLEIRSEEKTDRYKSEAISDIEENSEDIKLPRGHLGIE